jgi:hypothetical protein
VDGYRRAHGIDRPGLAKHEGQRKREELPKEADGSAPVQDPEARPTSERTRPERRSARHERQAGRDDRLAGLLGPQPTEDLRQRRAWKAARTTIERFRERTHERDDREREAG